MQSYGRVWIGGQNYDIAGPTAMSQGSSWSWSAGRVYGHDANGYRGAVDVSVEFWVSGTSYHANSTGAGTQGALDYDRKPAAPSTVTPVLNSDKSITVTSNAVSSPAGTATYYISYSNNGGSTWSSDITISGNARTYTFAAGTLTYGLNYKFRMKASNSDGTSAYTTTTSDTFLPAGGKRFDGSTWNATGTAKRFDGTSWITLATAKRFNGTSWVDLS